MNYEAGRSDGCTSWSASDAEAIMAMVRNDPTTLYIYPESRDIEAVARAVQAGESPSRAGLYWNAACLKDGRGRRWVGIWSIAIGSACTECSPAMTGFW